MRGRPPSGPGTAFAFLEKRRRSRTGDAQRYPLAARRPPTDDIRMTFLLVSRSRLLFHPEKESACRMPATNWNGNVIGRIWSAPSDINSTSVPTWFRIRFLSRMAPGNFGLHKLLQDGRKAKKPVIGTPQLKFSRFVGGIFDRVSRSPPSSAES